LAKLFGVIVTAYAGSACVAQECVPAKANFSYPPLAKAARVTGDVTARVQIRADGFLMVMHLEGHPIVISGLRNEIAELRYPRECGEREIDLRLVFRLTEPGAEGLPSKTTPLGPSQYEVLGFPSMPLVISDPAPDRVRTRRAWRRIFHWW
jgi:hypothetical protein